MVSIFKSFYEWLRTLDPETPPPHNPFDNAGHTDVILPVTLNNSLAMASISANCGRRKRDAPIPLKRIFIEHDEHPAHSEKQGKHTSLDSGPSSRGASPHGVRQSVSVETSPVRAESPMTSGASTPTELSPPIAQGQTPLSIQNLTCTPAVV